LIELLLGGRWQLPELASGIDLHDLRVVLGLLIVVQGFETASQDGLRTGPAPLEQRIWKSLGVSLGQTGRRASIFAVFGRSARL